MHKLLEYYKDSGPERVGFILLDGSIIEVDNKSPDPLYSFTVDPEVLIEYEDKVAATFHTHPGATSNLSGEDYQAFSNWPEAIHYIVGNDGVRTYEVTKRGAIIQRD